MYRTLWSVESFEWHLRLSPKTLLSCAKVLLLLLLKSRWKVWKCEGEIMLIPLLLSPPDFQTFLRPWGGRGVEKTLDHESRVLGLNLFPLIASGFYQNMGGGTKAPPVPMALLLLPSTPQVGLPTSQQQQQVREGADWVLPADFGVQTVVSVRTV